jgi:predicted amidohydrolase YtcJ
MSKADLIVDASTVHTMAAGAPPAKTLAIRDGRIAATAGTGGRRDLLAAWRGPGTIMIDDPGLVVLPAFVDTHNHLMLARQNILDVPVSQAADIQGLVRLIPLSNRAGQPHRAPRAGPVPATPELPTGPDQVDHG